jgi:hypothetical protein
MKISDTQIRQQPTPLTVFWVADIATIPNIDEENET